MYGKFVVFAVIPLALALPGCVFVGQPGAAAYTQPYPPPPFQPQCQQMPGNYPDAGPTISCTRPDGSVSTTAAPPAPAPQPPPPDADQGYANPPYAPPPPPGYYRGNGNGY